MRAHLVTSRRASGSNSFRINADRIRAALGAASSDPVDQVLLENGTEARRGGVLRPAWFQLTHKFPADGAIWHATEPSTALRGVDVVTFHDLYPFTVSGPMFWVFRWMTRTAARRARRIVVQIETVRSDVQRFLGPEAWAKTVVVPPPFETPAPGRLADRFDVLWVGSLEERKRPEWFLQQLASLPSPRLRVAFLCHRSGYGSEELVARSLEAARAAHEVEWISRDLSDLELDQLYRSAKVLVSSSVDEGYHYPVMEAWSRGTAILVPQTELYARIYGSRGGVRYYDPGGTFVTILPELLGAGTFVPDPALLESISPPAVGRRLWSVYRELRPDPPPPAPRAS
jgi:glycosyltransferase involved in cell wall biosynthesis